MFSPQYSGLKTLAENGYLRKLEDNEQIPIPTSLQLRCNSLLGYIHQPNRIICDDIEDDIRKMLADAVKGLSQKSTVQIVK